MFLKSCIIEAAWATHCGCKDNLPDSWREFEVTSFAQTLVESELHVCNIKGIIHIQVGGQIQSDTEWALQIKVSNSNKQSVISKIEEEHPYDVPQIVIHECEASEDYTDWVNSQ